MEPAPLHTTLEGVPQGGQAFWRTCPDGVRIRVATWAGSGSKGKTILIFPGRTEFIEKYGRVVDTLLSRGFCVAVVDWRGQGLSDRHPRRREMGWVEDFSQYQQDVAEVLDTVTAAGLPAPFAMIAHSMGGAIGLRALHNGLPVEKAIFSAPMWGIFVAPHLRVMAWLVAKFGPALGFGEKYVPGGGPENYVEDQPYEGNLLTNDEASYATMQAHIRNCPELGLGGPSILWYNRALHEMKALFNSTPPAYDTVTLLGSYEGIVSPAAIELTMKKWPTGKLVKIPRAQHEVLMEEPHVLEQVWSEIDSLLGV